MVIENELVSEGLECECPIVIQNMYEVDYSKASNAKEIVNSVSCTYGVALSICSVSDERLLDRSGFMR